MDKDYILEEIRRTAEANGGKPLGRERFEKETGTRRSDWLGRYWARWGDALQEAGFPPNSWQAPYEDGALLRSLAKLIRELGHIPVEAELRLRAQTVALPSHSAFAKLGTKHARIARLIEFCGAHGGYDDVLAICKAAQPAPTKTTIKQKLPEIQLGTVYLMKSGRYYKIGHTNAVGRRERELAIQLPDPVRVVHSIKTDDPVGIEAYWHRRFSARRKNGEWFELTREDVAAFTRRKFM